MFGEIAELLSQSGIYPAYHMSKKTWVSVLLDETVEDQAILALLEKSRHQVGPKSYKAEQGPDYWVIPANPKVYDIDTEFAENKIVYWYKINHSSWNIVAIYVTAPVQAIRYVCRVLGANLENQGNQTFPTEKKVMQVELIAAIWYCLTEGAYVGLRGPRRYVVQTPHKGIDRRSEIGSDKYLLNYQNI